MPVSVKRRTWFGSKARRTASPRLDPVDAMDEGDDAVDAGLIPDRRGRSGGLAAGAMAVIGMDEGFRAGDLRESDPRLDDGARLVFPLGAAALQMVRADAGEIAAIGQLAMPRRGGEMDREFPQIRKKTNVFVFFSARGNDAEVIVVGGDDESDDSFVVPVVAKGVSWDRRRCRAARRVVLYG